MESEKCKHYYPYQQDIWQWGFCCLKKKAEQTQCKGDQKSGKCIHISKSVVKRIERQRAKPDA